jgi:integrase
MAQRGHFYRKNQSWHLRYYRTIDGVRVQKSRRICDGKVSIADAALAAQDFIKQISDDDAAATEFNPDQTVAQYWTSTYEKFIAKKRANTQHSYRVIWRKHLQDHFGDVALRAYTTPQATTFLSDLAERRGQRTVQHVRSLMSGIFKHAVAFGACKSNPITDCMIEDFAIRPPKPGHYTLEVAENIVSALVSRADAQLVFCLAFFAGLRPGEIAALQWGDFDTVFVHVRRAIGRGVVAEPKTERSIRSVPLIAPVRIPLELWRQKRSNGSPATGWVFPNGGVPFNIVKFTENVIQPLAGPAGFTTLYCARRGFATVLRGLTGDSTAGQHALGHTRASTTQDHYEQTCPEIVMKAMKLLEEKTRRFYAA